MSALSLALLYVFGVYLLIVLVIIALDRLS